MGYEAVRARLNLLAVLPNLEDVVRYDPEAADLIKGARITIQFVVAGGPRAFVRIADGDCTVSAGMAPGVRPMRMVRRTRRSTGGAWGADADDGWREADGVTQAGSSAVARASATGDAPGAGASPGASAGWGASDAATSAGAADAKEATVVLGFASCAHLNKMFDGKGNPIPLWGFTKIGFLTGTFTKLTERMAHFLKPTDELLADPEYLTLNTRLTLNTAAFAVPVLLENDPECRHLRHTLRDGTIGIKVLPDGPSVGLRLGPGGVRASKGEPADPSGLILMRDLPTASAYLNGKLDTFSAATKGEVQIWGQIGKIEAVGLVLDRVPKYLA
jgi:hypothetical protein